MTVRFEAHDLTAPWYLPTPGTADLCSPDGARNTYTCILEAGQAAHFRIGAYNFRDSGWIDVTATQDGMSSDPVRITVDLFELSSGSAAQPGDQAAKSVPVKRR